MRTDEVWRYVDAERAGLARLLSGLTAEQWRTPSACPGWTVRDVAAHVISSPQVGAGEVVGAMVRARGDFNRMVLEEGRRRGARYSPAEIVAQYDRYAGSRRHPLGTVPLDPLVDVLVHGQDIAVPLGLRREMPPEAARAAAERVWSKSFPFKARRRLAGVRLQATDIAWTVGSGPTVAGPMSALLLLLTGRSPRDLSGDGLQVVAARR